MSENESAPASNVDGGEKPVPPVDDLEHRLLHAIDQRFDKFEARIEARQDERFAKLEASQDARFRPLESTSRNLWTEVTAHGKQLADLTGAQVSTAKAASAAAEIAVQAMAKASSIQDETRKMVESAIAIQRTALAAEIEKAVAPVKEAIATEVEKAVAPVKDAIKTEVEKAVAPANEAMGVVVEQLGVEDQVELGRNPKPGDPKPEPALTKLSKGNTRSHVIGWLTFATVVGQIILEVLKEGLAAPKPPPPPLPPMQLQPPPPAHVAPADSF